MGTKNNPGAFDCYANALPDEPHFTLLARDPFAPHLLYNWASQREEAVIAGHRPMADMEMVAEARDCADAMVKWRKENDGVWRKPTVWHGPDRRNGERRTVDLIDNGMLVAGSKRIATRRKP